MPKGLRYTAVGVIAALMMLEMPRGVVAPRAASPVVPTCGSQTHTCCCGVAGGCGMCPTEPSAASRRATAPQMLALVGCPGPESVQTAPGGGPAYVVPSRPLLGDAFTFRGWLIVPVLAQSPSPLFAPELPPPRA